MRALIMDIYNKDERLNMRIEKHNEILDEYIESLLQVTHCAVDFYMGYLNLSQQIYEIVIKILY